MNKSLSWSILALAAGVVLGASTFRTARAEEAPAGGIAAPPLDRDVVIALRDDKATLGTVTGYHGRIRGLDKDWVRIEVPMESQPPRTVWVSRPEVISISTE